MLSKLSHAFVDILEIPLGMVKMLAGALAADRRNERNCSQFLCGKKPNQDIQETQPDLKKENLCQIENKQVAYSRVSEWETKGRASTATSCQGRLIPGPSNGEGLRGAVGNSEIFKPWGFLLVPLCQVRAVFAANFGESDQPAGFTLSLKGTSPSQS